MIRINPAYIAPYEEYLVNQNRQEFIRKHLENVVKENLSQTTKIFASEAYQKALAKQRKVEIMREQIHIIKRTKRGKNH